MLCGFLPGLADAWPLPSRLVSSTVSGISQSLGAAHELQGRSIYVLASSPLHMAFLSSGGSGGGGVPKLLQSVG